MAAIFRSMRSTLAEERDESFADEVMHDAAARLPELKERAPDPGMMVLRTFTDGSLPYIAFFLALKSRGWSAEDVWSIVEKAARSHVQNQPAIARWAAGKAIYSWPIKRTYRNHASRSQVDKPGGWSWTWVEGEGGNYGVDYTSCPIQALAQTSGAGEFGRYICLLDEIMSDELGWGLKRTTTIGGGDARCDFRFIRGAPTEIATSWRDET